MSILINRFEIKEIIKAPATVQIENKTAILIKDHTTDKIVSFIQLENDKEKNKEVAALIIGAIETWVGNNEAENQHEEI